MNDLYNVTGTVAWVSATSIGLFEWIGGLEVNSTLTTGSLILAIIYGIYRIRIQKMDLKLRKKEYEKIEKELD